MAKLALIYAYWPNQPFGVTWCDLPWALRDADLPARLHDDGHEIVESMVMLEEEPTNALRPGPDDLWSGFTVARDIADEVAKARQAGELPIVLCGSCSVAALGVIGGLHRPEHIDAAETGVAWFDAHADLNTPEITESGLFEGMALALIAGRAYQALAARAVQLKPIALNRTIAVGVRDMEPAERAIFNDTQIVKAASPDGVAEALSQSAMSYVHLDMDVHDPAALPANAFAAGGGPGPAEVRTLLTAVPRVAAVSVTGLDPAIAPKDVAADVAIGHIRALANAWETTP